MSVAAGFIKYTCVVGGPYTSFQSDKHHPLVTDPHHSYLSAGAATYAHV